MFEKMTKKQLVEWARAQVPVVEAPVVVPEVYCVVADLVSDVVAQSEVDEIAGLKKQIARLEKIKVNHVDHLRKMSEKIMKKEMKNSKSE